MRDPIITERLLMRPFTLDDVEQGFALWSDPDVARFIGGAHATDEKSRELIERHVEHQQAHGFSYWAVEERATQRLVGEVGLQHLEHTGEDVEIGWTLARGAWGRGYATEAARAWLDAAFGPLGLDEVIAVVRPENAASHRVAERLGMQLTGRRAAYGAELDLYAIRRADA